MPRLSLKQTIMKRDSISSDEANILIAEAQDLLEQYLDAGDLAAAEDICAECFNLEPDYLDDLAY